jgi:NAD(P)H-hydrate repair Nnr-like enzyme with NAD(P)H-hydrate epimerase domain
LAKLELDREKVQLEREKFERLKEKDKLMVAAATAVKKVADQASPELKRRIEEMYDIAIAA